MLVIRLTNWQANGGEVLPQENEADIKIVDHARKESLPGTCVLPESYVRDSTMISI